MPGFSGSWDTCTMGFSSTRSDSSLFVYNNGNDTSYLLLYVDDIVLTASSTALLQHIIARLRSAFAMKDLGPLSFFLSIQVSRTKGGFFLIQAQYAEDILDRTGMLNCKPAPTPVDTKPKASATNGELATDAAFYCNIVGALPYLTLTRPDVTYTVHQVAIGQFRVLHVLTQHQFTDIMTIGLPTVLFEEFWSSLCIAKDEAQTEGGVG
ncbi:uncharacterized mitochondrial protein AtMg00810-like [Phragmites australis]|uniref:uncharacterized mitochondrial protein AtMg00810-like n=1 Tax=Phragmites australis TaxID=29695 RepID=UPI002D7950FE|nr:uncharacterized mitochondrial protein AtMg00810-like [Phragmites australis]